MVACECAETHERRRIVLTGGPGAGKTAVLELIRQSFCQHVKVLPEAASMVFGGGFPRENDLECKRAAQRAIFFVQRELEITADVHNPTIVLCDRGTLDGLAYWPGAVEDFWSSANTTLAEQIARYDAVIHLRTPALELGYNHQNRLRTESAAVAAEIDGRILRAWETHQRRFIVESTVEFLDKAAKAIEILRSEMPECCRRHVIATLRARIPDQSRPLGTPLGRGAMETGPLRYTAEHSLKEVNMDKDVVCGMHVDPAKAAGTSQYNGKTYYFCSKACKAKFDANPSQFAK